MIKNISKKEAGDNTKPFKFNEHVFMSYPQKIPKDYKPIKVLTTGNEVKNVIQI